jgi:HAD superfamily hydrolase (TIGR01509 family)
MLSKANLLPLLDFYLSNQDVKKPKPDPEMYIKAIDLLQLDPRECLIVEDNFNGIKAALASGAHVLEVKSIDEVNLTNLQWKIAQIEASNA